jgi:hypothetical protein
VRALAGIAGWRLGVDPTGGSHLSGGREEKQGNGSGL